MLNEPSHLPKEYARPATQAQEFFLQAIATQPQINPPPQILRTAPELPVVVRRPGCVSLSAITAFFFAFLAGSWAFLAFWSFDFLLFMGEGAFAVLMIGIYFGLWNMERWAANLMILFCGASLVQIIGAAVAAVLISNQYPDNILIDTLVFGYIATAILGSMVFGTVLQWFWKTRQWFLPNTIFPDWEQTLYIVATGILILHILLWIAQITPLYEIYV